MSMMLTAKQVQELLHVDRSTVYRMAEAGRLPAMKVGRQWRFPARKLEDWVAEAALAGEMVGETAVLPNPKQPQPEVSLHEELPLACVQLVQDTFAQALGVMMVITDMEGNPVTTLSQPCGLFAAVADRALPKCIEQWREMAASVALEPTFYRSHLGLLCARGLIRQGAALKGMVFVGGIAPEHWPPAAAEVARMAADLGVGAEVINGRLPDVYHLTASEKSHVLTLVQRIADVVSHILQERTLLVNKLEAIADLTRIF